MGTINPAKGIQARERTLSDAELRMLWPHLRPLFKLLLLTGRVARSPRGAHRAGIEDIAVSVTPTSSSIRASTSD